MSNKYFEIGFEGEYIFENIKLRRINIQKRVLQDNMYLKILIDGEFTFKICFMGEYVLYLKILIKGEFTIRNRF